MPTFTIGVPVYNGEKFLRQALESALVSLQPGDEILLLDDGSTDRTPQIIESFVMAAPGVLRALRQDNAGAAVARNRLVREARGDFILWCDADDVLLPNTIATYHREAQAHPEADVLYGHLQRIDAEGRQSVLYRYADFAQVAPTQLLRQLLDVCCLPNPGTLLRRAKILEAGGYDPAFRRAQDYELWTRLATRARFLCVNQPVVLYRVHGESSLSGVRRHARDPWFEAEVVRRILKLQPLPALFPELPWTQSPEAAELAACQAVAHQLCKWGAHADAAAYARRSTDAGLSGDNVFQALQSLVHLEQWDEALALCARADAAGIVDSRVSSFAKLLRR